MKYIIEIPDEVKWGVVTCRTEDEFYTRDFDSLEELNSDYINEHYGDLQDTAYKKGLHDGESKCRYCNEYQRGLEDAWEAAKKIALMDTETSENVTGYFGLFRIMENLTPMQAIEKLKAYEEKRNDKIVVGDEFVTATGERFVVLKVDENGEVDRYFDSEGRTYRMNVKYPSMKKTGRHFDISSILEEMQS